MLKRQKKPIQGVNLYLIATLAVTLLAMLGVVSCTADSSEGGKSASTDASASSSTAAPRAIPLASGPAPTPGTTPLASGSPPDQSGKSYPPDTTNYARPARPGERTP